MYTNTAMLPKKTGNKLLQRMTISENSKFGYKMHVINYAVVMATSKTADKQLSLSICPGEATEGFNIVE